MRREAANPLTEQIDFAAGDIKPTADEVEQRGLAGAVRPDNDVSFIFAHFEIHASNDLGTAEVLPHAAQCEGNIRTHDSPPGVESIARRTAGRACRKNATPPITTNAAQTTHGVKVVASTVVQPSVIGRLGSQLRK